MKELTQDEINALLAGIDTDDVLIRKDTIAANLSVAMTGILKGRKFPGRRPPEDAIQRTRERMSRPKPETVRAALSKPGRNAGRIQSAEEKQKRSASGMGKNTGKTRDTNARILMGREKSKYIYQTPSGEFLSRAEVMMKYVSDTLTPNMIDTMIEKNRGGFSRTLK